MIKETFLHSEPNLCFWCADATSKKSSILKNILYNLTCMTETWKLNYIMINTVWKKLPVLIMCKINTTP